LTPGKLGSEGEKFGAGITGSAGFLYNIDEIATVGPDDTHLAAEIARQALTPEQIVYLDDAGEPSETPTNCLEVAAEFKGKNLVSNGFQSLREFGLFGGDATDVPDSGFMIDHVIHPRIDLSPGDTLERNLRKPPSLKSDSANRSL